MKPPELNLSDDVWAALQLQLRVDHVARDILDPHRYYAGTSCVAFLIIIVFYAIRPGYDRKKVHAVSGDDGGDDAGVDDDELYDDYLDDKLWERNHSIDDFVVAELVYLNAALDRSIWILRIGLIMLVVLMGSRSYSSPC